MPDITLILPAFNEAASIAATVREASGYFQSRGLSHEIVVAADGGDGTREICRGLGASGLPVQVIGDDARRGKGRGVREGAAIAQGRIIGYADADNKVPISEFDKVAPELERCPVVIGTRARERKLVERKQPLYRRIGSIGFHHFMQAVVGLPGISDSQCGFKFFRREAATELFSRLRVDGYMFDVEILYLCRRLGYEVREVPVRWRDDGDSRLDLIAGNLRNVRDIFRIRLAAKVAK